MNDQDWTPPHGTPRPKPNHVVPPVEIRHPIRLLACLAAMALIWATVIAMAVR